MFLLLPAAAAAALGVARAQASSSALAVLAVISNRERHSDTKQRWSRGEQRMVSASFARARGRKREGHVFMAGSWLD